MDTGRAAGRECVLWDMDKRVGVDEPWGLDPDRVAAIEDAVAADYLLRTK